MQLGTQTNSLVNHLYSSMVNQPAPFVGQEATLTKWTDRDGATVVQVSEQGGLPLIMVRADRARVVSGSEHDGSARYEFEAVTEGYGVAFMLIEGRWVQVAVDPRRGIYRPIPKKDGGPSVGLLLGRRDHYRDPSF